MAVCEYRFSGEGDCENITWGISRSSIEIPQVEEFTLLRQAEGIWGIYMKQFGHLRFTGDFLYCFPCFWS